MPTVSFFLRTWLCTATDCVRGCTQVTAYPEVPTIIYNSNTKIWNTVQAWNILTPEITDLQKYSLKDQSSSELPGSQTEQICITLSLQYTLALCISRSVKQLSQSDSKNIEHDKSHWWRAALSLFSSSLRKQTADWNSLNKTFLVCNTESIGVRKKQTNKNTTSGYDLKHYL